MKKKSSEKLSGQEAFDLYYSNLFDSDWQELKESLLKENIYLELSWKKESYFLDPASLTAAMCLNVKEADTILDMCAAPGGKTLVLSGIKKTSAGLNSNERSSSRKGRLDKVVSSVLPEEISSSVITSLSDASLWCKRQSEAFDSILLDAPCSSERHVLADLKYLKTWSPSRIKTLCMEQWALLSSAWRLLKKGGYLLYATCALNKDENDGRISRLLKKFSDVNICSKSYVEEVMKNNFKSFSGNIKSSGKNDEFDIEKLFSSAVKTEYGFHILPHKSYGAGPLYFTLLQKNI